MKFVNKKVLSMLIAAAMIAAIPMSAFAAETDVEDEIDVDASYSVEDVQETLKGAFNELLEKVADNRAESDTETDDTEADLEEEVAAEDTSEEVAEDTSEETVEETVQEVIEGILEGILEGTESEETESEETESEETESEETESEETESEEEKIVISNDIGMSPFYAWPGRGTNLPATTKVKYWGDKTEYEVSVKWTSDREGNVPLDIQKLYDENYNERLGSGSFWAYGHVEGQIIPTLVHVHFDKDKLPEPVDPTPEDPTPEDPTPEDPTPVVTPSDIPVKEEKPDTTIENVQTGDSDYAMAWVLFTMSAAAVAVSFSSKKFRIA